MVLNKPQDEETGEFTFLMNHKTKYAYSATVIVDHC
jgi:hypothetical protein